MTDIKHIQEIVADYPWLRERGRDCILSPDCDGFLCGLFMSHFYDWNIKGYYDGNALFIEKNTDHQKCVFLDMEICRPTIESIGQHMLYFNVKRPPQDEISANFCNCLSPNNIRKFDFKGKFMQKYPLATIHLLMALLPQDGDDNWKDFAPLFFVDGTFKNLLNYPENCLDWLNFLDSKNNVLLNLFHSDYPLSQLMLLMLGFFKSLKEMPGDNRPDRFSLTAKNSDIILQNDAIPDTQKLQTETFLRTVGNMTKWEYLPEKWNWSDYTAYVFEKGSIVPSLGRFQELMAKRPLSWAIISRASIEYTIDSRGVFD